MMSDVIPAERKVRVNLGDRSYDILIGPGLIAAAGRKSPRVSRGAGWPSSPMKTSRRVTSNG